MLKRIIVLHTKFASLRLFASQNYLTLSESDVDSLWHPSKRTSKPS